MMVVVVRIVLWCLRVLSGSHGEWTEGDDLAGRIVAARENAHRMRVAQHKRADGARAGNGGYGPPIQQNGRPPDRQAVGGKGSLSLREPNVVENIQGLGFVPNDSLLTQDQVMGAARNVAQYDREVNREYAQNAPVHQRVAAEKEAARQVALDVAGYQDVMREMARANMRASPGYVNAKIAERVAEKYIEHCSSAHPAAVYARVQAIKAEHDVMRQTQLERVQMALWQHEEDDARDNGQQQKKEYCMQATVYHKHFPDENGRMVAIPRSKENICPVATSADQDTKRKLSVQLVPVPFYVKCPKRTFWNWFLGGLFSPCYRWNWDPVKKVWKDFEHAEMFYDEELCNVLNPRFNDVTDNALMRKLLGNFRFCGMESETVASWYRNGLGYFESRGLTACVGYMVHPAVVEMARNEAQGCTVSDAFTKQQLKDLKKYEEWLPPDVVAQSIAVGMQQRDAIEYLFPAGLKAAKFVEDA